MGGGWFVYLVCVYVLLVCGVECLKERKPLLWWLGSRLSMTYLVQEAGLVLVEVICFILCCVCIYICVCVKEGEGGR